MASKRHQRRKACIGKRRYASQHAAATALHLAKYSAKDMQTYKCHNCHYWHVGHIPKAVRAIMKEAGRL